jgi:hypothetical protein
MKVSVEKVENKNELFCKYELHHEPQDCFIELDCDSGKLSAGYNPEIGNAVPARVFSGEVQRWSIPPLETDSCNELLEEIEGFAQVIVDGYTSAWNGSGYEIWFSAEAEESIEAVESICRDWHGDVVNWAYATDWFLEVETEEDLCGEWKITENTTDERLGELEKEIVERWSCEAVLVGVDILLERLRDFLDEEGESNDMQVG